MKIAILGATSEIAQDLIMSYAVSSNHDLILFSRRPEKSERWLASAGFGGRYKIDNFDTFFKNKFDAIINFVGVGNPAEAVLMGNTIFEVTQQFDEMAISYLKKDPTCRYLFLSSGAVYGNSFKEPVGLDTAATIAVNHLEPHEWYGVAKLYAECRHRAYPKLSITDIRVFNYFSRTQNTEARFLIMDIFRAIRDNKLLNTSSEYMVRDFMHPSDFYRLITALLSAPATNGVIDCYTQATVDKPTLLSVMQKEFGLQYGVSKVNTSVNATGSKPYYYSLNRRAAEFGYRPELTSLEGVLREMKEMLLSC